MVKLKRYELIPKKKKHKCDVCNKDAEVEVEQGYRKEPLRFCKHHHIKYLKYLEKEKERAREYESSEVDETKEDVIEEC